jgi:glycosyltransferase involved in cell wall biosynthesis
VVDALEYLDDWHFVVLGDGSQRNWLKNVARRNNAVHYFGTVSYEKIPGYTHIADVGINLIDDPNTLKVLEYGASGLPVVHVEGDAEAVFGESVTFCSLDPGDVADAVRLAKTTDADEVQMLAQKQSWESLADTYEQVLEDIIADFSG